MPEDTETARGKRRPAGPRSRSGLTLLAVFVVACIGAAFVGRLYFDSQRALIIAQKSAELTAIRDLKIDQIVQWRDGLLADGKVVVDDPTVRPDVAAWAADPNDLTAAGALRAWMDAIVKHRGYASGLLLAPGGSRWIATTGGDAPSPQDLTDAAPAFRSTDATLTDLFIDSQTGVPGLHVVAPLRGGGPATPAVLLLHRDPTRFLYPLLQGWPTPSPTSETMLLRSDGDSVLYLNELRFRKGTALKLRLPTSSATLLAVQTLTGVPRVVEGIDYRGEPVVGAVGQVPGTPWFIVAKVDQAEAYAAVYQTQRLTLMALGLLVVAIGLGLAVAWRQRAAAFYRQRMEAERAARLLAQQYDYVTRYANDVVLLADAELRIVQVNDRATAVYGYTREELLAMTLPDLGDPASREETQADARIVKEQGSRLYEARQMRKDGTLLDMEVSARAIEPGGQTMYLSIIRDITERKRAEEELRIRTEELVRSNSELEKFAYVASHDLQEPLRMVASYTQLLQKRYQGKLDSDADEFIGFAVDGATRMQALINELLAYSRVGTQGAPFAPTDLAGVLDRVLRVLEPAMTESGGDVTRDPLPTVSCDATQMGQVFQNLISNALKFRGDRPPRIHVGARETDGEWVFSVRDNGIGVETAYFDRIFVIFQRLQPRAEYPGTGMGLAICKRIIERHGGRIWVESKPEEGSTFYFTLRDDREE